MIAFANCKINLGLHVTEKRADGYHNLDTVFYPVKNLYDVLEIKESAEFSLHQSGITVQGDLSKNLVYKAYELLQKQFGLPGVETHVHKAIPMGAGLGGGSADASFMLQLLSDYFDLKLSKTQLLDFALQLGSDCPFFIYNTCCSAHGRGEVLQELPLDLSAYSICLIKPPVHVSTAQAFAGITPLARQYFLSEAILQPIHTWRNTISNDFEQTIFGLYPEFESIKQGLYDAGAIYVSMSGTGSTVFGIFEQRCVLDIKDSYWFKWLNM
jgi:4-diphosphocytidyl-2-C-methyl-D-erythritol kinase